MFFSKRGRFNPELWSKIKTSYMKPQSRTPVNKKFNRGSSYNERIHEGDIIDQLRANMDACIQSSTCVFTCVQNVINPLINVAREESNQQVSFLIPVLYEKRGGGGGAW